jgi:hypothetical protein
VAFSQATITDGPILAHAGRELVVTWASSSPDGTVFQVYLDGSLTWFGTARRVRLPWPSDDTRIEVGTVAAGEGATDFSGSLPAAPNDRVRLDWTGGSWQGADLAGFRIYQGMVPGGAVDYTKPVATVPATVAGVSYDGWGLFAWGSGRWGQASVPYSWTSGRLAGGVWTFAVVPFDQAGNEQGTHLTVSATVVAPPRPPAADGQGVRLSYTLDPATRQPTLTWLASPG